MQILSNKTLEKELQVKQLDQEEYQPAKYLDHLACGRQLLKECRLSNKFNTCKINILKINPLHLSLKWKSAPQRYHKNL